jgi:hypothetical protein
MLLLERRIRLESGCADALRGSGQIVRATVPLPFARL